MSTRPESGPTVIMDDTAVEPEPSLGQLVRRLVDDTGELVRSELKLAQTELKSNVADMAGGATMIGAAAVVAIGAFGVLLSAFVGWLTPHVGDGWAAFIVAVVTGLIAYLLLQAGLKKLGAASLTPTRAAASLKQDAELIKGNR